MGIAELKAADRKHQERRQRMEKGVNAARNRAAVSQWVGGTEGSQMTGPELEERMRSLKADCMARHLGEWF